jgi:hypothetical protein
VCKQMYIKMMRYLGPVLQKKLIALICTHKVFKMHVLYSCTLYTSVGANFMTVKNHDTQHTASRKYSAISFLIH